MIKTHEMDVNTSMFNQLEKSNYLITDKKDIEINDYILFKQTEIVEVEVLNEENEQEIKQETKQETKYTGLYSLVQIRDVITHQGLKEGFVLVVFSKV